jgi:methyl-accepting chemotaxis protein
MFKSLKTKINAAIIILVSMCMVLFMTMTYFQMKAVTTTQMKNDGTTLITSVSRQLRGHDLSDVNEIARIFYGYKEESRGNIVYVSMVDANLKMLVSSDDVQGVGESQDMSNEEDVDAISSASKESSEESMNEVFNEGKISGFMFETPEGEKVYNISMPFNENGKFIGTLNIGISLASMNSLILKGMIETAGIGLIILIVALIIGLIISNNLSKPLAGMAGKLGNFSNGDFTVKFISKNNDEIGRLAEGLNNSINILKETMVEVKQTSVKLKQMSQELSNSGMEVAASSEEVSQTINGVNSSVSEQAYNINQITEFIDAFVGRMENILLKATEMVYSGSEIKESADLGAVNLKELITSIDNVRESFKETESSFKELNENVSKIDEITGVINNVARKTNLLALNAAIEAARAGEYGRGFAVVADEIRKLAEQVMESSKDISSIINLTSQGAVKVNELNYIMSKKLEEQMDVIEGTVNSFGNIRKEIDNTMIGIDDVNKALDISLKEMESIKNNVEELAAVSEEVSASMEEIDEASVKQSDTITRLSNTAQDLNSMAEILDKEMQKFKV